MFRKTALLLCLCLCFSLIGCSTEVKNTSVSFTAMDTYIKLSASEEYKKELNKAKKFILSLDKDIDRYKKDSLVSQINKNGGGKVSGDLLSLFKSAKKYAEQTNGAFNPCLGNVIDLWKIGKEDFAVPKNREIKEASFSSFYTNLDINGQHIILENGATLDFGGIAKGYASQKSVEILKDAGVKSALLDIGGNIGVIGAKENGEPWVISIADPLGVKPIANLRLEDCFAVTSGDYQRYSEANGKKYCHIFNNFGKPVSNKLTSVTVVCDNGEKADAYSTALFVMGLKGAKRFYEIVGGFEAVYVTHDKRVIVTPGLSTKFEHINKGYTYEVQES